MTRAEGVGVAAGWDEVANCAGKFEVELLLTNFDAEWINSRADAMREAVGVGETDGSMAQHLYPEKTSSDTGLCRLRMWHAAMAHSSPVGLLHSKSANNGAA